MSAWAKPGARCVCIRDDWRNIAALSPKRPLRLPCLKERLTVIGIKEQFGALYLRFLEIPDTDGGWYFHIDSFRPLVERPESYDLAVFYSMLDEVGVKA